jgi:hypothetical protein
VLRRPIETTILSGALAVIGWALGPYFGIHLWSALHALGYTPPHETFQNALLGDRSRLAFAFRRVADRHSIPAGVHSSWQGQLVSADPLPFLSVPLGRRVG